MGAFIRKHIKIVLIITTLCLIASAIFLAAKISKINSSSNIRQAICPHCNIILVTVDVLGSNHLPCYGYEKNTAPNLCKFAENNILFTNSYSNASWTLPSTFSIFTSLYPKHHLMESGQDNYSLSNNIPTITQILKAANYHTIYIGLNDNSALPLNRGINRGFDEIIKYQNMDTWEDGYKNLIDNELLGKRTFLYLYTYILHSPYGPELYQEKNGKYLLANKKFSQYPLTWEKLTEFPEEFYDFLLTQYQEKVKTNDRNTTEDEIKIYSMIKNAGNLNNAKQLFEKTLTPDRRYAYYINYYETKIKHDKDAVAFIRSLYDEAIYHTDENLGKLFDLISNGKLSRDTIVIITSQHGEEFMEHENLGHQSDNLKNTITGVPLIMYIPGIKQKNIGEMVQSIDIIPTILNLVGINKPSTLEGLDLTDMILNKAQPKENKFLISEGTNIDSIRDQRWKLSVHYLPSNKNKPELYDLVNDLMEKNNIADKYPEVIDRLSNSLESIIY